MVPITGSGSSRAFPPRRGHRAARRLASRAWCACSERLTTRREHRWTGPELRAAGKLQANAALTRGCHGVWYQRNRTGYKRMSRTCQNSFVDMLIDIHDGQDHLLHHR